MIQFAVQGRMLEFFGMRQRHVLKLPRYPSGNPRIDAGMVNNDGMYRLADSMTNSFKFALVSPLPSWVRYG